MKQETSEKKPARSPARKYWAYYICILGLILLAVISSSSAVSILCVLGVVGILVYIGSAEGKRKEAEEAYNGANTPAAEKTVSGRGAGPAPSPRPAVSSGSSNRKKEEPDFTLFRIFYYESPADRAGNFSVSSGVVKIMQQTGRLFIEYSHTALVDPHSLQHNSGRNVTRKEIDFDMLPQLIDETEDERAKRYRGMNAGNWRQYLKSDEPFPRPDLPVVFFGHYPAGTGIGEVSRLPWYVLDKQEDRCLLLCRDVIECLRYNRSSGGNLLYGTSLIRAWLNKSFLNRAFSPAEQDAILRTDVRNVKILNPEQYNNNQIVRYMKQNHLLGQAVTDELLDQLHLTKNQNVDDTVVLDKVFLLSAEELKRFIPVEKEMAALPTEHAVRSGVETLTVYSADTDIFNLAGAARWWLRDLYTSDRQPDKCLAETGSWFGGIGTFAADTSGIGVRPALCVRRDAVE